MLAMHYQFELPAAYDMQRIRARAAEKARVFDALPSLTFKAFLCRDRAAGATANVYSTFYIWNDMTAALDFLRSELFGSVVTAFGRPAVSLWPVLSYRRSATTAVPGCAVQKVVPFNKPPGQNLPPDVFARVAALDTVKWQVVQLDLLTWSECGCGGDRFEIIQLSEPRGGEHVSVASKGGAPQGAASPA